MVLPTLLSCPTPFYIPYKEFRIGIKNCLFADVLVGKLNWKLVMKLFFATVT